MVITMKRLRIEVAALMITLGIAATSHGAGFAIIEQSVKGMGEAYSGGSTATNDASCVFYNPAAMSLTGKSEVDAGASVIMPRFSFKNDNS